VAASPLRKYPGSKLSAGGGSSLVFLLLTGFIGARGWHGSDAGPGDYPPAGEVITSVEQPVIIRRIHVIRRVRTPPFEVPGEPNTGTGAAPAVAPRPDLPAAAAASVPVAQEPVAQTRGS